MIYEAMPFARLRLVATSVVVVSCAIGCNEAGPPAAPAPLLPPPATQAPAPPVPGPGGAADAMAAPAALGELRLASSTSTSPAIEAYAVYVTRAAVYADKPPKRVFDLPPPAEARQGFAAVHKRSGPHDLFLVPLANVVPNGIERAVVYFDRETPYRIMVEILFTLGAQKVSSFQLATVSKNGKTTKIDFSPPTPTPCANGGPTSATMPACADVKVPPLNLTMLFVQNGISLKTRGGNVAPGCNDMGPGLAVPRASGGAYDYAALATCAARLRGAKPEFETDDSVIVTANPEVTFESLVAALDAVRATSDGRAMFTKVQFAVPR